MFFSNYKHRLSDEFYRTISCFYPIYRNGNKDVERMNLSENEIIDILRNGILNGFNIDKPDDYFETPLMCACKEGHLEVCRFLINEAKVDIEATNCIGLTPLMISVMNNRFDICKLLLISGADVRVKSSSGSDAIDFSLDSGEESFEINKLLMLSVASRMTRK